MNEIEIWKDINGYEGKYQVSNFGRIKSLKRKVKSSKGGVYEIHEKIRSLSYGSKKNQNKNGKRYAYIVLSCEGINKTFLVHRLVAKYFLENPNNYSIVNHKDENPENDRYDNLEWCDYKYNNTYRNIHLRRNNDNIKSKIIQYDLYMKEIHRWNSISEASKLLNIEQSNIISCCLHKRNHAGGFKWRYYE